MDRILEGYASPAPPGDSERSTAGGQDPGLTVLGKTHELFQICDLEGKGFITCQDTQIALNNEMMQRSGGETACTFTCEETMSDDEDEEFQFSNLMNQLGAKKVLDDESDVKRLWLQLRKDEPHLLSSFEELLVRIFSQLQAAENEKNELECILKKRIAAYDEEIQHLYEEVEQQIKKEKEQFLLKDAERFQSYSKELECKLLSKEEEMEQLAQNQKWLEQQRTNLLTGKEETKVENTKLKLTNQELMRDLERTSHKLSMAQQQLQVLQKEASRLNEEKEMERNSHLKDGHDVTVQKCKIGVPKASWKQRPGSVIGKDKEGKMLSSSHSFEDDGVFNNSRRRNSGGLNGIVSAELDAGAIGEISKASHLQRIISIEEDHLPQLLDRLVDKQMNRWTREDKNTSEMKIDKQNIEQSMEHSPSSSREQSKSTAKAEAAAEVSDKRTLPPHQPTASPVEKPNTPKLQTGSSNRKQEPSDDTIRTFILKLA